MTEYERSRTEFVFEYLSVAAVLAVVIGWPLAVLASVDWSAPLYATREVVTTDTQAYGLLIDLAGGLLPWLVLLLVIWMLLYGPRFR